MLLAALEADDRIEADAAELVVAADATDPVMEDTAEPKLLEAVRSVREPGTSDRLETKGALEVWA